MLIKSVEIKNNSVRITTDKKSFSISLETYLNNSIVIGDEISEEKIQKLINLNSLDIAKIELIRKISRKKLSKLECREILNEYHIENDDISKIINDLEKNYLINDLELAEFLVDYYMTKKKGINYIKNKVIERKITVDDSFYLNHIDKDQYAKNTTYMIDKYTKLGNKKSNIAFKNFLIAKMLENGYNYEDFKDLIVTDSRSEKENVITEIKRFLKFNELNSQNISKITKKLLSKGFNYDIIKEAIRSVSEDETY